MDKTNYQNGKIYKIIDVGYTKCCYGSTTEHLSLRLARHRAWYRHYKAGRSKMRCTSYDLFDELDVGNCKIELVELYPCNSREELLRREGYYIKENTCVNKVVAGRSRAEYASDNRTSLNEKAKAYREANREVVLQRLKTYRDANKEVMHEKNKAYREANTEREAARRAMWREKNYGKYHERHICPVCNGRFTLNDKTRHEKSRKHTAALLDNKDSDSDADDGDQNI